MINMGFLEKQIRTLGFLISIFVEITLVYILIDIYEKLNTSQLGLLIFLILTILLCAIGQVKYYKVAGYKYTVLTWPSLILGILFVYMG